MQPADRELTEIHLCTMQIGGALFTLARSTLAHPHLKHSVPTHSRTSCSRFDLLQSPHHRERGEEEEDECQHPAR